MQEVLRRILSAIYEPIFDQHSHGFRPSRSCHTALRDIRKNFKGSKWIIEGDISRFFDEVSHNTLIKLLEQKIKDPRFIKLIKTGLKVKIILPEKGSMYNDLGVPQGGVLSPLLSNVYLHELDKFMKELHKEYNIGLQRPASMEYRRIAKRLQSRKKARDLGLRPSEMTSDLFKRLSYVRYADDFLIGLSLSRSESYVVRSRVETFLNGLGLRLDLDKTQITDVSPSNHRKPSHKVSFLGYEIGIHKGV